MVTKSKKAILEGYKRSNKTRRPSIIKKYGFKSERAFLLSLGVDPKKKPSTNKKK